ncbi:hypothetical protein [Sphingomonas sp. Root241]|uniref:hypothetical protein n=1 Tax=Sphingomonas sp. Root241 TaxID=1736501 RepID=UPI0006FDE150|nr:hypothetical protein [Sphingomonas sp. Root241]KRC81721.1 hypothetical protein ASE13_04925 [Sphingomonas sp. Root241]
MKTVLGFDSWTGGAANFARLVPAFREHGLDLVVLHIGSWGGDPGRPAREFKGDLELRDISHYGGKSIDEVLEVEQPAAVLFLSNEVFAHRAFNRYSLAAGIPTLLLYHGLVSVQGVASEKPYKVNPLSQARFVLERLPKALLRIWPAYGRALVKTSATREDWTRFVKDIFNMGFGRYSVRAAEDSRTTRVAVYTQADQAHAIAKYGQPPESVAIVGNPDLHAFGVGPADLGIAASAATVERSEIIYIDTGLIYAGMVFDGAAEFLEHLERTHDALRRASKTLAIKLHPDHFRTDMPDRIAALGIEILNNQNFVSRLKACAAAIVEPSTAALIPGLVGVPLLLAGYGKLSGQAFGEVLTSYPRARHLLDPSAVTDLLLEESRSFDAEAIQRWLDANSGPLPGELMPSRVAATIIEMIETAGASLSCAA